MLPPGSLLFRSCVCFLSLLHSQLRYIWRKSHSFLWCADQADSGLCWQGLKESNSSLHSWFGDKLWFIFQKKSKLGKNVGAKLTKRGEEGGINCWNRTKLGENILLLLLEWLQLEIVWWCLIFSSLFLFCMIKHAVSCGDMIMCQAILNAKAFFSQMKMCLQREDYTITFFWKYWNAGHAEGSLGSTRSSQAESQ